MGLRVLIVDDSAMMRKMIAKVLAMRGGHTVVGEAKNGMEALELYKTLKPELVTMDITMDPMDGLTAAREILLYDSEAHILFLSNLDKEKYDDDIQSIGAIGFVNKHRSQDILDIIDKG
jgi:two-component system chemotaxis response regulator CheY